MKIPTTVCPDCDREWPDVSTQGETLRIYGHCYACLLGRINKNLHKLQKMSPYTVLDCETCRGLPHLRDLCAECSSLGWLAALKK